MLAQLAAVSRHAMPGGKAACCPSCLTCVLLFWHPVACQQRAVCELKLLRRNAWTIKVSIICINTLLVDDSSHLPICLVQAICDVLTSQVTVQTGGVRFPVLVEK